MRRAARPMLLPLVPLYRLGVWLKNMRFDARQETGRQLARPVISVGSLSAGGAGKTPVVLALAELLRRHGVEADVLSRGYGRDLRGAEEVRAEGTAEQFGDEPLEMARAGLKVFVAAERYAAGALAEATHDAQTHLLDDGFQHRRLARSLDLVLLTQQDVDDRLLPAGNLREPLAALGRADVVVLREEEAASLRPVVEAHSRAEVWLVRRELVMPEERPLRPLVFCGIARPEGFLRMLEAAGVRCAGAMRMRDHHVYAPGEFCAMVARARELGADGFCTTRKDAVKLSAEAMRELGKVGPVWIVELRVSFVDEARVMPGLRRALSDGGVGA